eukprot:1710199-Pyramimonas_sp.AAC.1
MLRNIWLSVYVGHSMVRDLDGAILVPVTRWRQGDDGDGITARKPHRPRRQAATRRRRGGKATK